MATLQLLGLEKQERSFEIAQDAADLFSEGGWLANFERQGLVPPERRIHLPVRRGVRVRPGRGAEDSRMQRREANIEMLRPYVGEWVVLVEDRIISHGRDPVYVVAEARARGVRTPYIFRVQEREDGTALLGF